ncbi:hypothetical protein J6590_018725 [Homalodisca vitripennis]|nr:hypothetical protein J6590_018725 [Homalodisca vitripennis]
MAMFATKLRLVKYTVIKCNVEVQEAVGDISLSEALVVNPGTNNTNDYDDTGRANSAPCLLARPRDLSYQERRRNRMDRFWCGCGG